MAGKTKIEWTDATWTPIRARNLRTGKAGWHCEHATTGCEFCYAESMNLRLGTGLPFKPGHRRDIEIFLDETMLTQPLRWKKPRMIFVCSMTDLFARFVTDEWLDRIFAVMALCPQHVFQVLTKRPERMRRYITADRIRGQIAERLAELYVGIPDVARRWPLTAERAIASAHWPIPNVWLGVSAEDQATANERIPDLLATPAAVRWVSAEPLLGPIDFTWLDDGLRDGTRLIIDALTGSVICGEDVIDGVFGNPDPKLDWIVAGGESGPNARPMHPDWARSIRDQCTAAAVPFLFKQWGAWIGAEELHLGKRLRLRRRLSERPLTFTEAADLATALSVRYEHQSDGTTLLRAGKKAAGRLLDGRTHDAYPAVRP